MDQYPLFQPVFLKEDFTQRKCLF